MAFRARRGDYIRVKNGRYYYRRAIPAAFREYFGGKREWVIPLRGASDTERRREAQEIAAKHDRQLSWEDVGDIPAEPDDTTATFINFQPEDSPVDQPAAVFWRDGRFVEVSKIALAHDPEIIRRAEREGHFAMSPRELELQYELLSLRAKFEAATTDDARELADLRAANVVSEIEREAASAASESILSVLEPWRAHRQQAPKTWQKHEQYTSEFTDLHGDLKLGQVTKRHVVQYIEHVQKMTTRQGEPLSPGSIAKRLDSIKALFSYAVSADLIDLNPTSGVKPPRDTRPKTSRSWKSFDREEIDTLVETATKLWSNRRASRKSGRRDDLVTALHCLIWTGARPEEICQLRRSDVDIENAVLDITNDETDDDAPARRLKNARSAREIPIHSNLLPIIAAHLKRSSEPLLFPSFEPIPTQSELAAAKSSGRPLEIKGRYSRAITREWTDCLRDKIVPNEPRKVLYSLRHSWAAESRRTGMPEHVRNAIMGHTDDNPHAARYGNDADWLDEKRRHVEKMVCATNLP